MALAPTVWNMRAKRPSAPAAESPCPRGWARCLNQSLRAEKVSMSIPEPNPGSQAPDLALGAPVHARTSDPSPESPTSLHQRKRSTTPPTTPTSPILPRSTPERRASIAPQRSACPHARSRADSRSSARFLPLHCHKHVARRLRCPPAQLARRGALRPSRRYWLHATSCFHAHTT